MGRAVGVLGPVTVRVRGDVLGPGDFGAVKPKQVFEILVLARGRTVTRDQLADWLWGEHLPKSVGAALATYVSVLRSRLPDPRLVETQSSGYRFAVELAELDLDRFDELVAQAPRSGPGAARALYEQAVALVRGELVEDERYAEWAEPHRTRYREATVAALLGAAEGALACRDVDAALTHAERALQLDSVCERGFRAVMLSAYVLGRQEDALRAYQRCEEELGLQLGVEVMEQTRDLAEAIRHHRPIAELLPAPAWDRLPAAIDLRSPRLGLLGRATELGHLRRAVDDAIAGSFVLTMVEGPAGMGKSRLVDELLANLRGVAVGRTRCSALERKLPFVPLAMALRAALPASSPDPLTLILSNLSPDAGEAGRVRALEQLAELARSHCPMAIVLEELHWSDEATVTGLSYLGHRCDDLPLAVIATVRSDELPPDHPANLLRPHRRICLGHLTREDLAAAGLSELYEITAGHPLLVAECIDARASGQWEDLPVRLGPWVNERAQTAGPWAKQILATAALVDNEFEPEDLAPVLDIEASELAEHIDLLCRAGLLKASGGGYSFRCDLVRDVVLGGLSPPRRRLLRQRLHGAATGTPHPGASLQLWRPVVSKQLQGEDDVGDPF